MWFTRANRRSRILIFINADLARSLTHAHKHARTDAFPRANLTCRRARVTLTFPASGTTLARARAREFRVGGIWIHYRVIVRAETRRIYAPTETLSFRAPKLSRGES